MSGLYTDSHKRYSKKIFSQTANPMRRNLKHGIAQHIWNYACVVDIQLHCNVNTHIYIYHIYLPSTSILIFSVDACAYHLEIKRPFFVYAVILPSSHIRKCVCTPNVEGLKSYPNCTLLVLRQRLKINKKLPNKANKKCCWLFLCLDNE